MFGLYSKTMGYVILTIVLLAVTGGLLRFAGVFGERVVFSPNPCNAHVPVTAIEDYQRCNGTGEVDCKSNRRSQHHDSQPTRIQWA